MKRILEVVGRMDRAGQEAFLMNLLRTNDSQKYEVTFSVNTSHIGDYEPEILQLGGKVWHNPYPISPRTIIRYLKEFRKFLRDYGPFDVIHCHVYYFGGLILREAAMANIPVRIMHSHSTNDGRKDSFLRTIYRNLLFYLIKKYSTNYVACGVEAYEALFREPCNSQDKILNNGVIMKNFHISASKLKNKREELGIGENTLIVINVARFCKVKNHEKIVSIFHSLSKLYSDTTLLLVGEGERMPIIKGMVQKFNIEDKVKFLGMRTDIPELLGCADVLLMPSLFEGLPVSLIEAQAAGLPCVVSNIITTEVDMGLDIVRFVSLYASDEQWANELIKMYRGGKMAFELCESALTSKGYTIESTWKKLRNIYE